MKAFFSAVEEARKEYETYVVFMFSSSIDQHDLAITNLN